MQDCGSVSYTHLDVYKRQTDEEFLYNNWAYDEPNNYHNIIEGYGHIITGDYTSVNKYKTLGTWNDSSQDGAGYANRCV